MYKINKIDIEIFLKSLNGKVYAPLKLIDGTVSYGLLIDGDLTLDNVLPVIGPKSVLFPPTERLLYFESSEPVEILGNEEEIYLFGVRSCDIAAINHTDKFFCEASDYCDNIYSQRRNKTTIIALATESPADGTFKTPEHTSSIAQFGYDTQFIEYANLYFVEIGTEKGKELIKTYEKFFTPADRKEISLLNHIKKQADKTLPKISSLNKALSRLYSDESLDKFWQDVADMCIECGGCSYVCPGCTCFNVYDMVNSNDSKSGYRLRSWDSCIFKGFTKESSGHNSRKEQKERIKRRYTHKLTTDNRVTCFGCNRCTATCPVSLGITTIINKLDKDKTALT